MAGQKNPQLRLRVSSQYCCCAGGTAVRGPVENSVTPLCTLHDSQCQRYGRAKQSRLWSLSWNCEGKLTPPVPWTQTGKRTMREPRPTNFLRTGLNVCLTSCAPIPPLDRKSTTIWDGSPHTPHGTCGQLVMSPAGTVREHETQIHCKSQTDVDCCRTGDHSMRRSTLGSNCGGGPTRQRQVLR